MVAARCLGWVVLVWTLFGAGGHRAVAAEDLGTGRLAIAGTRLVVAPESQTVPFDTPTVVTTELVGFEAETGVLPPDLRVVGELSGPEIDGLLTLETAPGEPFRIPRLGLAGQYQLDDIRLVQGGEVLAYAAPRSVGVLVTQVLVTRVTSRPLSLDEVRAYGVVVDPERFQAHQFTFGFAVDGEVVDYNVPVLFAPQGERGAPRVLGAEPVAGETVGTVSTRFRPPQMAPFTLQLEGEAATSAFGGCTSPDGTCFEEASVRLPGVILFPADVGLLHQFFSVVLLAKNDAPAGDALVIRDLAARVTLPPALRLAETEPPTALGVPVPVRVPGPDGRLGTGDDLTFLVAQAEGQAEVLVEGRQTGTHQVEFQLEGVLDGLPSGEPRRITGSARGVVLVRDPRLGITISHPEVVRADEEYTLRLTVSNTSNAPANLITFALPPAGLSGAVVVGTAEKTIDQLLPGESELIEFRLRSLRTGKVVAASARGGSALAPRFELRLGVGENGIPLSPETLILPRATEVLPPDLVRGALGLVGLGFSLANAPAALVPAGLPRLGRATVDEKIYQLAQAGRHVRLGEEEFDALAVFAAEWNGARTAAWDWDELRRTTRKGASVASALAAVFAEQAAAQGVVATAQRFAATTAFLGPVTTLTSSPGAALEVVDRQTGRQLAGLSSDPLRVRTLPFAELYGLGSGQLAVLARPGAAASGHRVFLRSLSGGLSALTVVRHTAGGTLETLTWPAANLTPQGAAWVELTAGDGAPALQVDADGDGTAEASFPVSASGVSGLAPRPFAVVGAAQNAEADPSGHIIEVLFSGDVDLASLLPLDPRRFVMPGKVSNGGLIEAEAHAATFFEHVADNPFVGLRNSRIVRVIFNNPVSPLVPQELTVRDVRGARGAGGQPLSPVTVPVATTMNHPGIAVEGTVRGPDGTPVPFARVDLWEVDACPYCVFDGCVNNRTAAVQADHAGRFRLDYVRQTPCSDVFTLQGTEPASGHRGSARGKVRRIGETLHLDIVMLGRGTVRGRVRYTDGTVPAAPEVVAYSPVFADGRRARVAADGTYVVSDVPVGTVSLSAGDRLGSFVYQTVEIATAGAVVERDLTIPRRSPSTATGVVRGTVTAAADGATPVADAYLALYVDGALVGVQTSDPEGRFDFGTVPAGGAEIEAFDGITGLEGAQVFFTVLADRVNEVNLRLQDDRGTVEGRVLRRTLNAVTPVAGATVWVSGTPFNTLTDAQGFYRLEGVFAGERTLLAADLVARKQVSTEVSVSAGGTVTRDLYFVEQVGSGLAGEVLGFAGTPVAGATVHLAIDADHWWQEVFTDPTGRFVIPDLTPGTYEIHAVSGNAGASARATIRFEGETPFVTLRFQKGVIRGVAQALDAAGQPQGVRSLVTYRTTAVRGGLVGPDWQVRTLETAADGSFEIRDVLVGRYTLTVSNAFHGEQVVSGELESHGQVAEHTVLFQRNGRIRGTVFDIDGQTPRPGAMVHLRHPAFAAYEVTSDSQGRFLFDLVPPVAGHFPIEVSWSDGTMFRQAQVWVTFTRFGQELDVPIPLPRQGNVSGGVERADGTPVPGAVVTLQEQAYPHRRLVQNADGEGRFSFTNVFVGRHGLVAQAPTLGGLAGRTTVDLTGEGDEAFGLIRLEATGAIRGLVTTPAVGQSVATVQVQLERWLGGFFDATTSDGGGGFEFSLLPVGEYRVTVLDPRSGRHGRSDWWVITSDGQEVDVEVVLEARGGVVGHLREPGNGLGVSAATVQLNSLGIVPFVTYSTTSGAGEFEFSGIPAGPFALAAREPEGRRRASASGVVAGEGEQVLRDLTLEASGRVVGSVKNPPGQPAGAFANANVLLTQDAQRIGGSLANPFSFDGVIADRPFELEAREVGGNHRGRASGQLSEEGQEVTLDLEMEAIGQVAVTVRDSFAQPVPGATVSVFASGFYGPRYLSATTDGQGRAVFSGVGAGTLAASAQDPVSGLTGSAAGVLTLEAETVELGVALEDAGAVQGRVLLADGVTPAAEALVVLTRSGRTLQTLTAADGRFTFPSVPLGAFTVFAQQHFGRGTQRRNGAVATNGAVVQLGDLVLDELPPRVVNIAPASGERDVALDAPVVVTFSEPMDISRFDATSYLLRTLAGEAPAHSRAWSGGGTVLTLTPTGGWASFTTYEVWIREGLDPAGQPLAQGARGVFTSRDTVPPAVLAFRPKDGTSQVRSLDPLEVTFTEPVDAASLAGSALQLTDLTNSVGVSTAFELLPGGRVVRVNALAGLATDRQYRLRVQGVRDPGGNTQVGSAEASFWTLDTVPPVIQAVSFPAGNAVVAGNRVPVHVQAGDVRGVARVTITVGEWVFTDTTASYELSVLAPVVSTAGNVPLTVTAYDLFGNHAAVEQHLTVSPRENSNPPGLTLPCSDGVAVPGEWLELGVAATDDEALERVQLAIDGVVAERLTPIEAASRTHSFLWRVPAAAVGTTWTAQLSARDFAGNETARELTLTVPTGTILRGDRSLFNQYAGQALVLANGRFLVREPLNLGSLTLTRGAVLVPGDGRQDVTLGVTGGVTVQCGARIDADQRGFAGGTVASPAGAAPAGVTPATAGSGGSHGGIGSGNTPGAPYGSFAVPAWPGGGGAYGYGDNALAGGGVVRITAGAAHLDGELLARGAPGACGGGGAGGTLHLTTGALSGAGTLDASAADMASPCGINQIWAGGGGGRVAIEAAAFTGFDPALQAVARGGDRGNQVYGGPGTVFFRAAPAAVGTLKIDNGLTPSGAQRPAPAMVLPALGSGILATFEPADGDLWVGRSGAGFRESWVGAWLVLSNAAGDELGAFEAVERDAAGRLRLRAAAGASAATTYRGEYHFDEVLTPHGASYLASDPVRVRRLTLSGEVLLPPAGLEVEELTVQSGAVVRPASGSTLRIQAERLTVAAGASLDVSGLGYAGGNVAHPNAFAPDGVFTSPPGDGSGGGHGGQGTYRTSVAATGEVFDSVTAPRFAGSGGAMVGGGPGPSGGGVLELTVGEFTLDGQLLARGAQFCSGGGGGTLRVQAAVLRGSGTLDASGADQNLCYPLVGGPGGGGRVALDVGHFEGFDPVSQILARGGRQSLASQWWAAPGTIFWRTDTLPLGVLRVDQRGTAGLPVPETFLPSIGRGVVGTVTTAGADAWIEPADAAKTFHVGVTGMWVRIAGVDYPVLEEVQVGTGARRRLRLGGAAGAVIPGQPFVGVYKFDAAMVAGGARLTLQDVVEVPGWQVSPDSSLVSVDLTPPTLTVTSPDEGAWFDAGQTISVTATATDAGPVSQVSFRFAGVTVVDPTVPYQANFAAPAVTTETEFTIDVTAQDGAGNVAAVTRRVRVRPLAGGAPPSVGVTCPSGRALVGAGTTLQLQVNASGPQGIEKVELFELGQTTALAVDTTAPYTLAYTPPVGTPDGTQVTLVVRARSFAATSGEVTLPVKVLAGTVVSTARRLAPNDTSLDGQAVIVSAGGVLTVDGNHSFRDLVVLDGGVVNHSAWSTTAGVSRLEANVSGDVFVACGGTIEASGKGWPGSQRVGAEATMLWEHFDGPGLAGWQVVDLGNAGGPSAWALQPWKAAAQTGGIYSTVAGRMGTLLRWTGGTGWTDYRASIRVVAANPWGLGVMFRQQDGDNHYRFHWGRQYNYRVLERVVNGVPTTLAGDSVPYQINRWYQIELVAEGSHLEVWIDGVRVFAVDDPTFSTGTLALFTNGNAWTQFDDVTVRPASDVTGAGVTRALFYDAFDASPHMGFSVTDVEQVNGPSAWTAVNGTYAGETNYLVQGANTYSASGVGTYFRLPGSQGWADYRTSTRFLSADDDDLGVLVRLTDANNYYRFGWRKQEPAGRSLSKRVGGLTTVLASDTVPYELDRWYNVEVFVRGTHLEVWVDGVRTFAVEDPDLTTGAAALFTNANAGSYFASWLVDNTIWKGTGGSHGGSGGGSAPAPTYGSWFDPGTPGAGGGGRGVAAHGGGVVRFTAGGEVVIDGSVRADAAVPAANEDGGAGGSIRLEGAVLRGAGIVSASGGGSASARSAGGGGRVALHSGAIDAAFLARVQVLAGQPSISGDPASAGTLWFPGVTP